MRDRQRNFNIPYGKRWVSINIPKKSIIPFIFSKKIKVCDEAIEENDIISNALENPFSCARLSELAYKKSRVCILVSDITRPCPSYKFIPFLIKELKKAQARSIKVIFGLGVHRTHKEEEKIKLVGKMAAENCDLVDFNRFNCRFIGETSYGTPIEIFEDVLKSDFLIATGNIEYHYFAGYSGGAKAVMPGICSKTSIAKNHSKMLEDYASAGEFLKNPIRQDIEQVGRLAGIDFIFNVILDDSKNIVEAVAGNNNSSYLEGIKLYDSIYEISVAERADIVITSPGGYPKDINLYQAQKALDNIKDIVKENGIIIFVAECSEGFGEETFEEWISEIDDYEKMYKRIKEGFVLGGHKAVAISKLLTKANIYAYSNNEFNKICKTRFNIIDNIQDFIDSMIRRDSRIRITVVPNGRFIKFVKL